MRKLFIIVLVTVFVVGICVYLGLSDKVLAEPPELLPGSDAPVLLTIAKDIPLASGQEYVSDWQDVKNFRLFKFYAHVTPHVTEPPFVRIHESPLGDENHGVWRAAPLDGEDWNAVPPDNPASWQMISNFNGMYSMIRAKVRNESTEQIMINLYVMMAKE